MPASKVHLRTSKAEQIRLQSLSPFELKDRLIQLAQQHAREADVLMLNAGRGNPNWVCTTPRKAFFLLGQFAVTECERQLAAPDMGGMPARPGIAQRLTKFLAGNAPAPAAKWLADALAYSVKQFRFDPDAFVHELTDSIIGDNYPVPGRMLRCCEQVVHAYLVQEMCGARPPKGTFDLFAVEGGTAAMCYIFDSLMQNRLMQRGDTIALAVPTFTPYLEIAELDRYHFKVVRIDAGVEKDAAGVHTWQYADAEIDKLLDPRIKVLFLVNPSNPPSCAVRAATMARLVKLVKTKRPDLMIITDDVYGTFVPGFRSLMAELPHNTIGVYSFSKHFGCTGWRLGVIALHQQNLFDKLIAKLPQPATAALNHRYGSISLAPQKLKFIDRMVADSRQVALNHTAGLSLPQQVQMALFSLFALLDTVNSYKTLCQLIVHRRVKALFDGIGMSVPQGAERAHYYIELDLLVWAERAFGAGFVKFLVENYQPVDILFRLAEVSGVVLMNGGGFAGPRWSVRVSLANLPEEMYPKIGQYLREAAQGYVAEWQATQPKS